MKFQLKITSVDTLIEQRRIFGTKMQFPATSISWQPKVSKPFIKVSKLYVKGFETSLKVSKLFASSKGPESKLPARFRNLPEGFETI